MNKNLALILEVVSTFSGFALVWYGSNWIVALGLFLTLLANNLMLRRGK